MHYFLDLFNFLDFDNFLDYFLDSNHFWYFNDSLDNFFHDFFDLNYFLIDSENFENIINIDSIHDFSLNHPDYPLVDL